MDDERHDELEASVEAQVADAIDTAESVPRPDPREMFDNVYAETTANLEAQYEAFEAVREKHGDDAFLED